MALSVSQTVAVSYKSILNEARKAADQWSENAFLRELERLGAFKREAISHTIERTLDYRRNQGAEILASDLAPTSLTKTEVLTAAQYTPASIIVPIVWSFQDEAMNDDEVKIVKLVKAISLNAINSHDEILEQALFSTSTNGLLGLQNLVPDSGQGSPGGIAASTETWWRNSSTDYATAGTDIEAELTAAHNACAKGSGGMAPNMIISSDFGQSTYEASQQSLKRYMSSNEADAGFKVIAFKGARFSFSQHESADRIYLLNTKDYNIAVSRSAFRTLKDKVEIPNAAGYVMKTYSLLQATVANKSRHAVITKA